MWPLEAMHPVLKSVTAFLPLTMSIDSLRSMTARNWGFFHPVVRQGFVSILVWILAGVLAAILSLKLKQGIKAKR